MGHPVLAWVQAARTWSEEELKALPRLAWSVALPVVVWPGVSHDFLCSRQWEAPRKAGFAYVRVMGLKEETVQGVGFQRLAIFFAPALSQAMLTRRVM